MIARGVQKYIQKPRHSMRRRNKIKWTIDFSSGGSLLQIMKQNRMAADQIRKAQSKPNQNYLGFDSHLRQILPLLFFTDYAPLWFNHFMQSMYCPYCSLHLFYNSIGLTECFCLSYVSYRYCRSHFTKSFHPWWTPFLTLF